METLRPFTYCPDQTGNLRPTPSRGLGRVVYVFSSRFMISEKRVSWPNEYLEAAVDREGERSYHPSNILSMVLFKESQRGHTEIFFFAWCRIGIAVLCSRGDLQFRPRPHAPEFTPSLSSDFGLMKGVSLLLQRLLSRKKKSLQGSGSYPGRLADPEQPPIQHTRLGSLLSA